MRRGYHNWLLEWGEMQRDKWNSLILIILSLWLVVTGIGMACVIIFSGELPRLEWLQTVLSYGLGYVAIGWGPTIAYLWRMKKRHGEIDYRYATVLAICAATPIIYILLELYSFR